MVTIESDRACVRHGHEQKKDSKTDKLKGTVIKCFSFAQYGKEGAIEKARAMHYAIIKSQEKG